MCFGSLRDKLTGWVHGVSCICRGRARCTSAFHNAEFVCLVSKLTQSALEWEYQDFPHVQCKGYVDWERNDDGAINVSICRQCKMFTYMPMSSFSSPNTRQGQTRASSVEGLQNHEGLERLPCVERLRELGWTSQEKSWLQGERCWGHFTVVHSRGIRDSRHSLKQEMFRLDDRRNFISMRSMKLRSRLPGEVI